MSGFVYFGNLDAKSLKKLIEDFFKNQETYHIAQDVHSYKPKEGLPLEATKIGQVFFEKGELRWKELDGRYSATLLTEQKVDDIPSELAELEGEWNILKEDYYLVSTEAPHVSPKFKEYPKEAKSLQVAVYYKDKIATFVSPRRFKP